ncbi:MAG: DUF2934 domain-containing protein [bacterium]
MDNLKSIIEKKAYELYKKRGGSHGRDFEDWLEAEKEVIKEKSQHGEVIVAGAVKRSSSKKAEKSPVLKAIKSGQGEKKTAARAQKSTSSGRFANAKKSGR